MKVDIALIEKPTGKGLNLSECKTLYGCLNEQTALSLEIANPNTNSQVIGFITESAANKYNKSQEGLQEFVSLSHTIGKILADTADKTDKEFSQQGVTAKLFRQQPKNTQIDILYRDSSNYKSCSTNILTGECSEEQIKTILSCLFDKEYFIPEMVGLDSFRDFDFDPEIDNYFWELRRENFISTTNKPTTHLTPEELVQKFLAAKDHWCDYEE